MPIILHKIYESVIDPNQGKLSEFVFKDNKLLSQVRFKILKVWTKINQAGSTGRILIVGSIGTFNYSEESDVDVTIQWLDTPETLKAAQKIAISNNGTQFAGPHEINYFVRQDLHHDYYDAIYDVLNDKWLKGPAEIGVNVNKYMDKFEEVVSVIDADKAELLQDLADYRAIEHATSMDRGKASKIASQRLAEIEQDVDNLADEYLEIKASRNSAFQETDLERIRSYGRKNALPENVIYLLLRRYCYLHFLHRLYNISDDGIDVSDIDDVERSYEQFGGCRVAKGFDDKLSQALV